MGTKYLSNNKLLQSYMQNNSQLNNTSLSKSMLNKTFETWKRKPNITSKLLLGAPKTSLRRL